MIKLQLSPDRRVLTQFAWASPIGFGAFGWMASRLGAPPVVVWSLVALGPMVLAAHLAGIRAVPLQIFRVLVLVGFPIGFVVSTILVCAIYYGVFTPIGLVFRAMGRDAMHRRIDRSSASYWTERPAQRPATSYFKLY